MPWWFWLLVGLAALDLVGPPYKNEKGHVSRPSPAAFDLALCAFIMAIKLWKAAGL